MILPVIVRGRICAVFDCGYWKNCRRFLEGPNFMPWFQRRRAVAEHEQHRIWRQARSKADVQSFLTSMTEVEIVDSFSAVERHLIAELQVLSAANYTSVRQSKISL